MGMFNFTRYKPTVAQIAVARPPRADLADCMNLYEFITRPLGFMFVGRFPDSATAHANCDPTRSDLAPKGRNQGPQMEM